ncbi:MAG: hypothetical protein JWL59_497 [Chthoniobacteraceae bacterium]|nr:hypothetical protein [Chthoniobacteraceae bacterium]
MRIARMSDDGTSRSTSLLHLIARSFVGIDIIEKGLDVGAVFKAAFKLAALQHLAAGIIPAAFAHELVPDFEIFLVGLAALGITPIEDFLIAAAFFDAFNQRRVGHLEKINASSIKSPSQIWDIIGGQRACGMKPDFIKHPAKIRKTSGFFVGTAKILKCHNEGKSSGRQVKRASPGLSSKGSVKASLFFALKAGTIAYPG